MFLREQESDSCEARKDILTGLRSAFLRGQEAPSCGNRKDISVGTGSAFLREQERAFLCDSQPDAELFSEMGRE